MKYHLLFLLPLLAACGKAPTGPTSDNKITAAVCAPNVAALTAQFGGVKGESYPGDERAGGIGYRFETGPIYWMQATTDGTSWSCSVKAAT